MAASEYVCPETRPLAPDQLEEQLGESCGNCSC